MLKAILLILIPGMIVAWLSYDLFLTITQGETFKIRMNDKLQFSQYPFIFLLTVAIKLAFYVFMLVLIKDGIKLLRKR